MSVADTDPTRIRVITGPSASDEQRTRVFDSPALPADPEALTALAEAVRGADLAAPPVVLPDFHHERHMEAPCSIAVATRNTIRPTVNNASVNCGMALIAFDVDRPRSEAIADFYRRVRSRYPYPPTLRRDLSSREVVRCAAEGSAFATERFDVDPAELDRVEERGRIDLEPFGGPGRVRNELPRLIVHLSRTRFGTIGPSNHFVELQEVEEVFDPIAAGLLGVSAGQVTLQYHAGGGVLTGLIGRLYGRRTDFPRRHRAIMAVQKPLLHLAGARSLAELRLRRFLYFSGECPPIPRDSLEGVRLMLANAAAMNYGFAFRLAVYQALRSMAGEALGAHSSRLVVDSPHDTMYEEDIDGQRALVHRYKSCRAYPPSRMAGHPVFGRIGQPVLVPGLHSTSSYLCVADEGASESLYSACHGTGSVISDFARRGLSGQDPQHRSTLRFRYSDAAPVEVPHLDDHGIDEAVGVLVRHRIVRPVARLRPFAVLT